MDQKVGRFNYNRSKLKLWINFLLDYSMLEENPSLHVPRLLFFCKLYSGELHAFAELKDFSVLKGGNSCNSPHDVLIKLQAGLAIQLGMVLLLQLGMWFYFLCYMAWINDQSSPVCVSGSRQCEIKQLSITSSERVLSENTSESLCRNKYQIRPKL